MALNWKYAERCFQFEKNLSWSVRNSLYLQCSFHPLLSARFKIYFHRSVSCTGISAFCLNFVCLCWQEFIFIKFNMVDSMSTLSSLELTRNPFDNSQEERINCPGFSPSMFCNQETPASQKVSEIGHWQDVWITIAYCTDTTWLFSLFINYHRKTEPLDGQSNRFPDW